MKLKLLCIIAFSIFLANASVSAKNYIITKHNVSLTKVDSSVPATIQLLVQNSSSAAINIKWSILTNDFFTSGWKYQYCDLMTCFVDPATTPATATDFIDANSSGAFSITVLHFNNKPISATMKIVLWDVKDASNTDTITLTVNALRLGIENNTVKPSSISLFPNPSKNYLTIKTADMKFSATKAIILNTFGQKITEQVLRGGDETIPVFDLPKGIYFLRLEDQSGREAVQQFVKD